MYIIYVKMCISLKKKYNLNDPGLQRNPFKTNNSKISNDPDAVFSPLLTAKCRNRPSSSFLLKLLLSHTGKLLAEVEPTLSLGCCHKSVPNVTSQRAEIQSSASFPARTL